MTKAKPKATAKPSATTNAKPSKPVAVTVPVDRALKAAWDKQSKVVADATRNDARAWDAKYEAVGLIADHSPPLYLAGGFATFTAFAEKFLHEDIHHVRDWIAVAQRASPDEIAQFSATRLALILSFLRSQTKDGALPKRVEWNTIKITVGKTQKRAVDATLDEIRTARRSALAKAHGKPHEAPEVAAVRAHFAGKALEEVTVQYRDGKFWFGAVPGYAAKDFARAVLNAEWEDADKPKASKPSAKPQKKRKK